MLYCVYNVFGIYTAHVSRGTIHLIPKGREFSLPLDPRRYKRANILMESRSGTPLVVRTGINVTWQYSFVVG